MSCHGQTENPTAACNSLASSGVPPQENAAARQIVEAALMGMPVPYEMAVLGAGERGDGYSLEDIQALENPAGPLGWTLAHELARRGRFFTAAEVRALGNPDTEDGRSLVRVVAEAQGRLPYVVVPETFAGPDEFAVWLEGEVNGVLPDLPEDMCWSGRLDGGGDAAWLALCFDEPQDVQHVKQLMGYIARSNLAIPGEDGWDSEDLYLPEQPGDGPARLFIWPCDFTKTYSDDIAARFYGNKDADNEAYKGVAYALRNGSPVRKTNRAGPGTQGTRLVNGIDGDFVWSFG